MQGQLRLGSRPCNSRCKVVDDRALRTDLLQIMRGFPPVQIFLFGLVFGLLAWPLVQLTSDNKKADNQAGHDHSGHSHDGETQVVKGAHDHPEGEHRHVEVSTLVRLRFAHQPLTVSLKQADNELTAKLDLSASPVEFRTGIEVSHEGNEFILVATWPEGTPDTALTVELEPEGFDTRSETRWSSGGELNEVLTFTW